MNGIKEQLEENDRILTKPELKNIVLGVEVYTSEEEFVNRTTILESERTSLLFKIKHQMWIP